MPRIRTLKPEFWADEKLAPLAPLDRLVFLGLISMADDAGRVLDNVRVIDAMLFPQTPDTALEALRRLAGIGRIRRGKTASGQRIIEIAHWNRHQKISHPNYSSAFPEIIEDVEDTEIPEALRNGSGWIPEALRSHTNDLRPVPVPTTNDLSGARKRAGKGKPSAGAFPSWVAEAHAMYSAEIGMLEFARIGKALKPAVDAHGWDVVRPWFAAYCRTRPYQKRDGSFHGDNPGDKPEDLVKDTRFCSPEDFVKNLATWRDRCAPLVPK